MGIKKEVTYIDTDITDAAVRAAWWPIHVTRSTPFHPHVNAIDINMTLQDCLRIRKFYLTVSGCNDEIYTRIAPSAFNVRYYTL